MSSAATIKRIQMIKIVMATIGAVLILAGITMVLMDIRDTTDVSFKTTFMEGKISGTLVGVIVVFFGFCIELAVILKTYRFRKTTRIIQTADSLITEKEESEMCRRIIEHEE